MRRQKRRLCLKMHIVLALPGARPCAKYCESYMDLGESPRNKDGHHFHGNEARGEKMILFSLHIFHTDHNKKIHCTLNVQ